MEEFRGRDVRFVTEWLRNEGFRQSTVDSFEAQEVDGDAFISLEREHIKLLFPTIGPQAKFIRKHQELASGLSAPLPLSLAPIRLNLDGPISDSFNQFPMLHVSPTKEPELVVDIEGEEADMENNGPIGLEQQKEISSATPKPAKKRVRSRARSKPGLRDKNSLITLPVPLPLPKKYPTDVAAALSRQSMNKMQLTRLITQVARVIVPIKAYPSKEELIRVATQLINEYPFIESTVGVTSTKEHIVEVMRGRLKDVRRKSGMIALPRKKLCVPQVTSGVRGACQEVGHNDVHIEPGRKLKREEEQSDDEENSKFAYEMHAKALQKEFLKPVPNQAVVDVLMDVTFHMRRKEITCSKKTVGIIAAKFPFLTSREQLIMELSRILNKPQLQAESRDSWLDWIDRIHKATTKLAHIIPVKKLFQQYAEASESMDQAVKDELKSVYAIALLSYLIYDSKSRTDHHKIMNFFPETTDINIAASSVPVLTPVVLVCGAKKAVIVVEKKPLCDVSLSDLPLAMLATFYCFDLQYPKGFVNFFSLCEMLVLNHGSPKSGSRVEAIFGILSNT